MTQSTNEPIAEKATRRVLYVDDMRELRDVARMALSRSGHTVLTAPGGEEAIEILRANPESFDIIITDHHMAGMNGIELVMKLREMRFPGAIAIVSSELNREVSEDYRRLGVEHILYKPVELSDLRALVVEARP